MATLNTDPAIIKFIGQELVATKDFNISSVTGGLFVNLTSFLYNALSTFLQFENTTVTIRDSFTISEATVMAPLITFEFNFSTEEEIEIGSKSMRYQIFYNMDIVGRTQHERDKLTHSMFRALETRSPIVSDFEQMRFVEYSMIGQFIMRRSPRNFYISSLRLQFELIDLDNES